MKANQELRAESRESRAGVSGPGRLTPRARLFLAAGLFVGWLGYLLFLVILAAHPVVSWWPFAITKMQPIVLSRPQFLVSPVVVIAEVKEGQGDHPDAEVTVTAVHRPTGDPNGWTGKTLTVTNLPKVTLDQGWNGPGEYILPLLPDEAHFRVTPLPSSPGFDAAGRHYPLRIYPANPQTLKQLDEVPQP